MRKACLVLAWMVIFASFGCGDKKEGAAAEDPGVTKAGVTPDEPKTDPAAPVEPKTDPATPAAPSGPEPAEDKDMLGLELAPIGKWKPVWDPDAKVAKWENPDALRSIVIRLYTDKLDNIDDLKAAAPMMMHLGEALTGVDEEKKTDKGWYAIVKRNAETDLIYVQKYGSKTLVCGASLTKSDMGTIEKDLALKACESIKLKP